MLAPDSSMYKNHYVKNFIVLKYLFLKIIKIAWASCIIVLFGGAILESVALFMLRLPRKYDTVSQFGWVGQEYAVKI